MRRRALDSLVADRNAALWGTGLPRRSAAEACAAGRVGRDGPTIDARLRYHAQLVLLDVHPSPPASHGAPVGRTARIPDLRRRPRRRPAGFELGQ